MVKLKVLLEVEVKLQRIDWSLHYQVFLNTWFIKKLIKTSPLIKRMVKANVVHQTLTVEEIKIIFKYINSQDFYTNGSKTPIRDKVIIELLYYCGLRVSELINIKLS